MCFTPSQVKDARARAAPRRSTFAAHSVALPARVSRPSPSAQPTHTSTPAQPARPRAPLTASSHVRGSLYHTGTMLSSLPLQILFFFNGWYDVAYMIAMSLLFAWKGTNLPYPDELRDMLGLEVAIIFLLAIIEYARIFLGTKGNKTEQAGPLVMSLVLCLPALTGFAYFLRLQSERARPRPSDAARARAPRPLPTKAARVARRARAPRASHALRFRAPLSPPPECDGSLRDASRPRAQRHLDGLCGAGVAALASHDHHICQGAGGPK